MNGKHFDIKDMKREYEKGQIKELTEVFRFMNSLEKAMEEEKLNKTDAYYLLQSIKVIKAKELIGLERENINCTACGKEKKIYNNNVCKKCFNLGLRVEKMKK